MWFASPVEADISRPKVAPITAVVARRVRTLRQAQNLSGGKLAQRLNDLGLPWNRTSVAKFETLYRSSVTVEELLALAVALRVPPVMLLADPRDAELVPVADGLDMPPWAALLWMLGRLRVNMPGVEQPDAGGVYLSATEIIHAGWEITEATFELSRVTSLGPEAAPSELDEAERSDATRHRAALRRIRAALGRLDASGTEPPPLEPFVRQRADELGISLPHPAAEG